MRTDHVIATGPLPRELGNAVSDAIHAAMERGMETDEACCVAIAVACDYARGEYGDGYLEQLVKLIRVQRGKPLPSAS